jgi:hypothetical protein
MKTLILITGKEKYLRVTLFGLRTVGNYEGDITVMKHQDDVFTNEFEQELNKFNIKIIPTVKKYFFVDINKLFMQHEFLKSNKDNYDVIMLLGQDMIIQSDINEVFNIAYENKKLNMVYEIEGDWDHKLGEWWEVSRLQEKYSFQNEEWWNTVKEYNVHNPEFMVGVPQALLEVHDFLFSYLEKYPIAGLQEIILGLYKLKYSDRFNDLDRHWFFYTQKLRDGKRVTIWHLCAEMIYPEKVANCRQERKSGDERYL